MQLEVNEINKVFSPIKEELESGLDEKRDLRDQLNAKVRAYLDNRNEVNRQVKELISEVNLVMLLGLMLLGLFPARSHWRLNKNS